MKSLLPYDATPSTGCIDTGVSGISEQPAGAVTGQESTSYRFQYLPQLDSLRCLAIGLVMALHGGMPFVKGGNIGVDIFFVLSGFLITSLLFKEYDSKGTISISQFYLRRGLRLLPALYCFLAVSALLLLAEKKFTASSASQFIASAFYFHNLYRAYGGELSSPIGHTWSLGVEQQFYLLWPLAVLLLLRVTRSRHVFLVGPVIIALGVFSLRAMMFNRGVSVDRLYNCIETRADALMLGAAVAALLRHYYPFLQRHRNAIGALCLLSIGFLAAVTLRFSCHDPFMYRFGYFLVGLASAIFILFIVITSNGRGGLQYILKHPFLVWIGNISYGIYLWHPLGFAIASRLGLNGPIRFAFGASLSIGAAALSFYTIESYFNRIRLRSSALCN